MPPREMPIPNFVDRASLACDLIRSLKHALLPATHDNLDERGIFPRRNLLTPASRFRISHCAPIRGVNVKQIQDASHDRNTFRIQTGTAADGVSIGTGFRPCIRTRGSYIADAIAQEGITSPYPVLPRIGCLLNRNRPGRAVSHQICLVGLAIEQARRPGNGMADLKQANDARNRGIEKRFRLHLLPPSLV